MLSGVYLKYRKDPVSVKDGGIPDQERKFPVDPDAQLLN